MSENIQKTQKANEEAEKLAKEYYKTVNIMRILDAQLYENNAVNEELNLLKKDAEIYKLIGPVLIKQDLEEAKQNVAKRIGYITNEIKRNRDRLESINEKEIILQKKFQKMNLNN